MKLMGISLALGTGLLLSACAPTGSINDLADLTHVHNLVIHEGEVLVGTHEGVYAQQDDGSWLLRGEEFDVMGLTEVNGTLLASGHPGPTTSFPDPLGLLASSDSGATWSSRGLTGEVDFHLLDASGDTVVGAAANLGVLVLSRDGGESWNPLEVDALTDFAINPSDPQEIVLTSPEGLQWSSDGGETFEWVTPDIRVERVDWTEDGLLGATLNAVWKWDSASFEWFAVQDGFIRIYDIAAADNQVAVLDDGQVSVMVLPAN